MKMITSQTESSITLFLIVGALLWEFGFIHAFTVQQSGNNGNFLSRHLDNKHHMGIRYPFLHSQYDVDMELDTTPRGGTDDIMSVTSYMKYIGPYACLALRFPNLSSQSQKQKNVTGISLDFVLDTAANINTINAQVAKELGLEVVGRQFPGVGASGDIDGGDTFFLGDCTLEDYIPRENNDDTELSTNPTFMSGLTASALPVASPTAAGLLGIHFYNAFEGGVEFDWSGRVDNTVNNSDLVPRNTAVIPPSVTFYREHLNPKQRKDKGYASERPISVTILEDSYLPSVILTINGVQIPALLDTGSPITVLNEAAAKRTGVNVSFKKENCKAFQNPFSILKDNYKMAQAMAQGDVVSISGTDGRLINLIRSEVEQSIFLSSSTSSRPQKIYVGDIPGLEALDGLKKQDDDDHPAAILGMDVIRSMGKMFYRKSELYFSESQ